MHAEQGLFCVDRHDLPSSLDWLARGVGAGVDVCCVLYARGSNLQTKAIKARAILCYAMPFQAANDLGGGFPPPVKERLGLGTRTTVLGARPVRGTAGA